jgi:hypothetical protein
MQGLVDWTVRTVMLVLAGLVTLSMLGALSAMSNDDARPGFIFAQRDAAPPEAPMPERAEQAPSAADPTSGEPVSNQATGLAAAPVPAGHDDSERWLEAIAWALMALAFLAALALLLLFEGVRQLRRIAAAAEARGTMTAAQHSSR